MAYWSRLESTRTSQPIFNQHQTQRPNIKKISVTSHRNVTAKVYPKPELNPVSRTIRRPRFSFFYLQLSKNRRTFLRPSKPFPSAQDSRPKPQIHISEPKSQSQQPEEIQRRVRQSLAAPPPSFSERVIDPTARRSQQRKRGK